LPRYPWPHDEADPKYCHQKERQTLQINCEIAEMSKQQKKDKNKNLIHFKKGPDSRRNLKGAPKKLLSSLNKQLSAEGFERVSSSQVSEAFEILFNLTEKKLKAFIKDADTPMFFRIIAREMLSGKGPEMLEKMMDRAHGRSVQKNDIVLNTGTLIERINLQIKRREA
jgi:hypothetical protein